MDGCTITPVLQTLMRTLPWFLNVISIVTPHTSHLIMNTIKSSKHILNRDLYLTQSEICTELPSAVLCTMVEILNCILQAEKFYTGKWSSADGKARTQRKKTKKNENYSTKLNNELNAHTDWNAIRKDLKGQDISSSINKLSHCKKILRNKICFRLGRTFDLFVAQAVQEM